MKERLQKIIAAAGVASRRAAEKLITEGRVSVNGEVVRELGAKADARTDVVRVDGKTIAQDRMLCYIAMNKPAGYVTTMSDPQQRPTVVDLLGDLPERVYPVGRLDYESSGLLILTNDGDFTQKVAHPRGEVPKTYRVKVAGRLSREEIRRLERGIVLPDGLFRPEGVRVEKQNDQSVWLLITLREGRNRVIRRAFEEMGRRVARLVRQSIGPVALAGLKEGAWRHLTDREVAGLIRESTQPAGKNILDNPPKINHSRPRK
ncbi:MAG TPA: pseudouridine synthase [Smithellaceae bacterium]|nr:pseudouridine synthase [Smithellaceae bacterium]